MRNSFKFCWLSICLFATLAMVGCGGGSSNDISVYPVSPEKYPDDVAAAQSVVSSVFNNANIILGNENGGNASLRTSVSNVKELNNNQIGNSVVKALEAPKLLRAVITAAGGNIEGGLFEKEEDPYRPYMQCEIATLSKGVYERSVYSFNKDVLEQLTPEEMEEAMTEYRIRHYVIDGCDGDLRDGILYSLTIKPNAKITVENRPYYDNDLNYSFKGTITTDLTIKYVEPKEENFDSKLLVVDWEGDDITDIESDYWYGLKVSKKISDGTAYTFNNIDLNLTEISYMDFSSINGALSPKEYKGNVNVNISGIKGTYTANKVTYLGKYANKQQGEWVLQQTYYDGDYNIYCSDNKPDLTLTAPIKVNVTGDCFDNYFDYDEETGKEVKREKVNTANIKNVSVVINKLTKPASGILEEYTIDDAEAHVDVEASVVDPVLMIGDREVAFNKAKIDVTGLKYDYRWEPTAEEGSYQQIGEWNWGWVPNPEYDKQMIEMNRKCFGSAIVKFEAEETNNSVTIKADCDINKKTATLNLVNNGNTIVQDKSSSDKVLEFNFKTVDINATNVDIIADNKCEGAILEVKGVEKDGTKSERTYKVVNGKLVLSSSKDKQSTVDIPEIVIEKEIEDTGSIDEAFTEEVNAELNAAQPTQTASKSDKETLKIVKQNDGSKVATFEKKKSNEKEKDITSKIRTNGKVIAVVAFYGNEFTFVFYIDMKEASPKINGGIFAGKRTDNIAWDSPERIGFFGGQGKTIDVVINGNQYNNVPLNK